MKVVIGIDKVPVDPGSDRRQRPEGDADVIAS